MSTESQMVTITRDLLLVAKANEPKYFTPALMGMIATVVGLLPDEYFEKMTVIEPCGRVGCDCHLTIQPEGIRFLRAIREDFFSEKVTQTTCQ